MDDLALSGGFTNAPVEAAQAFRVALDLMARPGTIKTLAGAVPPQPLSQAAGTLLLTLCDTETPVYLAPSVNVPEIRDWITFHCGAPIVAREAAMYAVGGWDELLPLEGYPTGTAEYPDRSTTLIAELPALAATGLRLTGPGIRSEAALSLPEARLFQANATLFPCGLDFFFTSGAEAAALPRTTRVEDAGGLN